MTDSIVTLPDGAKLAYNVLGAENLDHAEPIVLVGGMSSTRGDWERLSTALSSKRPGSSQLNPRMYQNIV